MEKWNDFRNEGTQRRLASTEHLIKNTERRYENSQENENKIKNLKGWEKMTEYVQRKPPEKE
jgi:hypothetical protein